MKTDCQIRWKLEIMLGKQSYNHIHVCAAHTSQHQHEVFPIILSNKWKRTRRIKRLH